MVRRTWAPRGQTPLLRAWDRHDRLSGIRAVTRAPRRRRLGLYGSAQTEKVRGPHGVSFLRAVRRHVRGKLGVILDRWNVHRSKVMRKDFDRHASRIRVEWLPAYAPDLNPTEQVWNHTKYSDLANFMPATLEDLRTPVAASIGQPRRPSDLLRSFFQTAKLKL